MNIQQVLERIIWLALSGAQAKFSVGTGTARRYAPGFSPLLGFADARHPDFTALAGYCAAGEQFYCDGWAGATPRGWHLHEDSTMFKMLWQGAAPVADPVPEAIRLGVSHVPQALELSALTHPGPFGPRTVELGEWFGCFVDGRLIAMAGERLCAAGPDGGMLREISGVCTHPDFQGRGLARRMTEKLVRRQLERGEIPFLHVMRDNTAAHTLYARMGFRDIRESVVRVIEKT